MTDSPLSSPTCTGSSSPSSSDPVSLPAQSRLSVPHAHPQLHTLPGPPPTLLRDRRRSSVVSKPSTVVAVNDTESPSRGSSSITVPKHHRQRDLSTRSLRESRVSAASAQHYQTQSEIQAPRARSISLMPPILHSTSNSKSESPKLKSRSSSSMSETHPLLYPSPSHQPPPVPTPASVPPLALPLSTLKTPTTPHTFTPSRQTSFPVGSGVVSVPVSRSGSSAGFGPSETNTFVPSHLYQLDFASKGLTKISVKRAAAAVALSASAIDGAGATARADVDTPFGEAEITVDPGGLGDRYGESDGATGVRDAGDGVVLAAWGKEAGIVGKGTLTTPSERWPMLPAISTQKTKMKSSINKTMGMGMGMGMGQGKTEMEKELRKERSWVFRGPEPRTASVGLLTPATTTTATSASISRTGTIADTATAKGMNKTNGTAGVPGEGQERLQLRRRSSSTHLQKATPKDVAERDTMEDADQEQEQTNKTMEPYGRTNSMDQYRSRWTPQPDGHPVLTPRGLGDDTRDYISRKNQVDNDGDKTDDANERERADGTDPHGLFMFSSNSDGEDLDDDHDHDLVGEQAYDADHDYSTDYVFPMKVAFRIALRHSTEAMDAFRRNWNMYTELTSHGFDRATRYIAVWETPEGLWGVTEDNGALPLREFWVKEVAPQVENAEKRFATRYRKRRRLQGYASASDTDMDTDTDTQEEIPSSRCSSTFQDAPAPLVDFSRLSLESLKRMEHADATVGSPPGHSKTSSIGATHDDGVAVESGYLTAVAVLIQIAETLCSLHERRVALVVCRPDLFVVQKEDEHAEPPQADTSQPVDDITTDSFSASSHTYPTQPSFRVQLTQLNTSLKISGYNKGKIVVRQHDSDLNAGPNVFSYGGSTAGLSPHITDINVNFSPSEDEGQGALDGIYEEKDISKHLQYIAPEALSSKKPVGALADIYSWAVAAYELLTGRPVGGEKEPQVDLLGAVHAHFTKSVTPIVHLLPSVPLELSDVIQKAINIDPEERYTSMSSLLYDLEQVRKICAGEMTHGDQTHFTVGEVDARSRFMIPPGLLDREKESTVIESVYQDMLATQEVKTVVCWGVSGSGKSKLIENWAREKDAMNGGHECLVGWSKFDQHLVKPLNGFVQVFQSLLDRVFSDPLENQNTWRARILEVLGANANMFCGLLSPTWRSVLLETISDVDLEFAMPDWNLYEKILRQVVFQLLDLFATTTRPLILVIDDVQWAESSELDMWNDLFTPNKRHFSNALVLFSYRTPEDVPPTLNLGNTTFIQARKFSLTVLQEMCLRCFHLDPPRIECHSQQWTVLAQMVYKATEANPFHIKILLSWLVRIGVIYFDYTQTRWIVRTGQLPIYCKVGVEDFAQATILSLVLDCQRLLQILGCLPSRGVEIDLLARLADLPSGKAARQSLQEAISIGIVTIQGGTVQFSHDRHHQAALDTITPERWAEWNLDLANRLSAEKGDFDFLIADMLISAKNQGKMSHSNADFCALTVAAAGKAARSAAFDLAYRYLEISEDLLPITDPLNWVEHEKICRDIANLLSEVGCALHIAKDLIPKIRDCVKLCQRPSTRIQILTMLLRLKLFVFRNTLALGLVPQAFAQAGIDLSSPGSATRNLPALPTTAEEVVIQTADSSLTSTPISEKDKTIAALIEFVAIAGPTIYTGYPDQGKLIFNCALALALTSPLAKRLVPIAYLYLAQGITVQEGQLDLARAYYWRADAIHIQGSPHESSIGMVFVSLKYLVGKSLLDVDYTRTIKLCTSLMNYDVLTYAVGLDLANMFLSGRSLKAVLKKGAHTLVTLGDDLRPLARVFLTSTLQAVENMMNRTADLSVLWRLDGSFCTAEEAEYDPPDRPDLFNLQAATMAMQTGLVFGGPPVQMAIYAKRMQRFANAGTGLILTVLTQVTLCIYYLSLENWRDHWPVVTKTLDFLANIPANDDLQSIRLALMAIRGLREYSEGTIEFMTAIGTLESALEQLGTGQRFIMGCLALNAGRLFRSKGIPQRLYRGYVSAGYQAFEQCESYACMRLIHSEFPDVVPPVEASSPIQPTVPLPIPMPPSGLSPLRLEPLTSDNSITDPLSSEDALSVSKDPSNFEQKLSLESILRSFLVLASEKNKAILVRRVLQILMQVSRSDYACLALHSTTSNTLQLVGAGRFDAVSAYDMPLAKASDLCPSSLLLHCSTSKKAIASNRAATITGAIANVLSREPFFHGKPPKSFLLLPIFVQSRFAGVLYLSALVTVDLFATQSQVALLATFGAIVMEAHSMTASLEEAVRLRTSQLEAALATRQTFLSSISHELRTPLHSISGLCAVMENSTGLSDAQRENLSVITSSADDLQRIITAVLDFSKLEAGSVQPENIAFDLRSVLESAMDSVAHLSRAKGLELYLQTDVTNDPPHAYVSDPYRLRQCLLNLLSNAIKFTKTGSVSTRWVVEPKGFTIAVQDTGIGIAANKMSRLFNSFSQVDESTTRLHGGTGLGLSITRSLTQLMGGTAWAESEEGVGSTFFLFLSAPYSDAAEPNARRFPSMPKRTVLLCAQPTASTAVLKANLVAFGLETTSIRENLSSDDNDDPSHGVSSYDYIILDVDQLAPAASDLARLTQTYPSSRFIYLVSLTDAASVIERLDISHSSIVTKPVKAESLYENLKPSSEATSPSTGSSIVARARSTRPSSINKHLAAECPLRILFVDDNIVNRIVGMKILSKFGYTGIDIAHDGLQALEAAEKERYDVIFLDLQMPVMDGHTAVKEILASSKTQHPLCVALTANVDQVTRDTCAEEGFFAFLGKPLIMADLANILLQAYDFQIANGLAHGQGRAGNDPNMTTTTTMNAPEALKALPSTPPPTPMPQPSVEESLA